MNKLASSVIFVKFVLKKIFSPKSNQTRQARPCAISHCKQSCGEAGKSKQSQVVWKYFRIFWKYFRISKKYFVLFQARPAGEEGGEHWTSRGKHQWEEGSKWKQEGGGEEEWEQPCKCRTEQQQQQLNQRQQQQQSDQKGRQQ